ncbi:DNA-binding MarR family transcriptional regulator [Neisseria sp. HSC-16F19]|nr:MarR family winged helix-turn-helix transcriptional regulator [Neisseria sp. HSC-16F19]MCP2040788.1 DNA-binding MarR family transcriptional regulator [Neisseria sp. HSC-16F19]
MGITKTTQADEFGRLFAAMARYYHDWARQQGISYTQLAVLHTLVRQTHCTQKQISDEWSLPKQTLSTVCKNYLDAGLLTAAATDDKREKQLSLTAAGRALAEPLIARLEALEQHILTQFGHERSLRLLQEFGELSRIFAEHMEA